MRYAKGVIMGGLLSGIIFMGATVLRFLGHGADQATLEALWNMFLIWSIISVLIVIAPLAIVYTTRRHMFREFALFEIGGLGLFTPFWVMIGTELSGDSILDLLTVGVFGVFPTPGRGGTIGGLNISNFLLIPLFAAMILTGIIVLRPSFIAKYSVAGELPELTALKEEPTPTPTVGIEAEMPDVAPPVPDESSKDQLRNLLTEIGISPATIDMVVNAGFATVTELVATSPDQIAELTGMDRKSAEDLHMAVQKQVWFGGI